MSEVVRALALLLGPFSPYLAQEIWDAQGGHGPVFKQSWPAFDPDLAREPESEIVVQVNGKLRSRIMVPSGTAASELEKLALADPKILSLLEGKTVVKVIAVPDKLVNLVVR
jgi:leucyl-tRNA synthetase